MKNKKILFEILRANYIDVNTTKELKEVHTKKLSSLYTKSKEFKSFIDKYTSFLPKTVTFRDRYAYYVNGLEESKECPVCSKYVTYDHKFCSYECSSKLRPKGVTGPKVDRARDEKVFRKELRKIRPEYEIVKYGHNRSVFKHTCGREFEASNGRAIKTGRVCVCQHKRILKHNLATLKAYFIEKELSWKPIKFSRKRKEITAVHLECKHEQIIPVRAILDYRCNTCYPNKFAGNYVTTSDFKKKIKNTNFRLIGEYVNSGTVVRFKHKKCGGKFKTKPGLIVRNGFHCPLCERTASRSSYKTFKIKGRRIQVRGKEKLAINWLLRHTDITIDQIRLDSEFDVPKVKYFSKSEKRYRTYQPDFYIKDLNLLIEVKCGTTLGVGGNFYCNTPSDLWELNCAKAKASVDKGYHFKMLAFGKLNKLIKLPKQWYTYSHKEIMSYLTTLEMS